MCWRVKQIENIVAVEGGKGGRAACNVCVCKCLYVSYRVYIHLARTMCSGRGQRSLSGTEASAAGAQTVLSGPALSVL